MRGKWVTVGARCGSREVTCLDRTQRTKDGVTYRITYKRILETNFGGTHDSEDHYEYHIRQDNKWVRTSEFSDDILALWKGVKA